LHDGRFGRFQRRPGDCRRLLLGFGLRQVQFGLRAAECGRFLIDAGGVGRRVDHGQNRVCSTGEL